MTIILFTVFAGKTCSAVTEAFYANFGGDPFSGDSPHDTFMRQVAYPNGALCGTVHNHTAIRSPEVMNLKLHHRQMHYGRAPFSKI